MTQETNTDMLFDMEEAKDRLIGIADICTLLSEQNGEIVVTTHLMDHIQTGIREVCQNYLDVDKWAGQLY